MQLQRLEIRRSWDGNLSGEITIAGETGKVSLIVTEPLCQKLVEACAEALVDVAKGVARDMTAELITATKTKAIA